MKMAGDKMALAQVLPLRFLPGADFPGLKASGVESTARRGPKRAGDVPLQDDALTLLPGLGKRNGGEKGYGIRMPGGIEKPVPRSQLDNLAQVHDRDPVADMFDDA
jgi:hypothetical protein